MQQATLRQNTLSRGRAPSNTSPTRASREARRSRSPTQQNADRDYRSRSQNFDAPGAFVGDSIPRYDVWQERPAMMVRPSTNEHSAFDLIEPLPGADVVDDLTDAVKTPSKQVTRAQSHRKSRREEYDADYSADVDDSDEEYQSTASHSRAARAKIAREVKSESVALLRLVKFVRDAAPDNAVAQTLVPIINYYEHIANEQQVLLNEATSTLRNSAAALTLRDALSIFHTDDIAPSSAGCFADNLVSTLLANEESSVASSCLAPVYATSRWLACTERSVVNRVAGISRDICGALNALSPDTNAFPLQQVGDQATRRMLFLYNPTGRSWTTVEASYKSPNVDGRRVKLGSILVLDAASSTTISPTYQDAMQELVPLLTLASLPSSSPLNGALWDEDRIHLESHPQRSYRSADSGPVSILTAVYRANDKDLPPPPTSDSARNAIGWRVRLACARRLLILVQEKHGLPFEEKSLLSLLQTHLGAGFAPAVPSKSSRRVTIAERSALQAQRPTSTMGKDRMLEPEARSKGAGYQAFLPRDRYPCPFRQPFNGTKPCDAHFATPHGRSAHVMNVHDRHGVPFPDDSSEDGTMKIKCPNGCGLLFRSYKKAKEHTSRDCRTRPTGNFKCPWFPVIGCPKLVNQKGVGNHIRSHVKDARGPYQCHKCHQYYADRYTLGGHVDDCKGEGAKPRNSNQLRFLLSDTSEVAPRVIIIARSSAEAPEEWKAKKETLEAGLPVFGRTILQQFRRFSGIRAP